MFTVKNSTRDFFSLHGWRRFDLFLHGFFYLARADLYVQYGLGFAKRFPRVGKLFLNWIVPRYHAKLVRHEDAKKFFVLNKDVSIIASQSKKIVPFEIANRIVLKQPDHISVMDCPCRKANKESGCSSPTYGTKVCIVLGEPQTQFVLDHAATLNATKITGEEALKIIKDAHEMGWVHHVWLKDAIGGATYAMCNCCKCCCGGTYVMQMINRGSLRLKNDVKPILSSGYVAKHDESKCVGCGVCADICPYEATFIDPITKKARVDYEKCLGCGVCPDKCNKKAINLVRDPAKGIPLDLEVLAVNNESLRN